MSNRTSIATARKRAKRGSAKPPANRSQKDWIEVFALAKEKFPPDLREDIDIFFSNYTTGGEKTPPQTASDLATLHRVRLDEKTTDERFRAAVGAIFATMTRPSNSQWRDDARELHKEV
ncbi:MAG TPA: hypothetical protein V6D20_02085 [Candidatus Obscuribacterales bacterium]